MKTTVFVSSIALVLGSAGTLHAETTARPSAERTTVQPVYVQPAVSVAQPQPAHAQPATLPRAPAAQAQPVATNAPAASQQSLADVAARSAIAPVAPAALEASATTAPAAASNAPAPEINDASTSVEPPAHEGFYLAGRLGAGVTSFSVDDTAGNTLEVSGNGLALGAGIGGAIVPNLVLQLELNVGVASNPELSYRGQVSETQNASVALAGVGPSLTYYVMPADVSIAGAMLASRAIVTEDDRAVLESETGLGLALRVGKEWRVGETGLGIAGQYHGGFLKEKDTNDAVGAQSFSLNFTINSH